MKTSKSHATILRLLAQDAGGSDCIDWPMSRDTGGYGVVVINKHRHTAHRLAYELAVGPIPDGMFVCHKCDKRSCVRPSHLFLGTNADNMRDKTLKGRAYRGFRHHSSKITQEKAELIRQARMAGAKLKDLAAQYGINTGTVSRVANGRSWAHVTEAAQ